MVPHHSIHKSFIIITQLFHSPYYEDEAHVKCSLSRSDGNLNRFLTSWRFYSPHKPHSLIKWATDHRVALCRTNSRVRQAPPVPEDRSGDQGIQGIPRLHAVPSSFSSTITNIARTSGRFPAQIVLRLRGRNDLSLQLSVRQAFNMAVNDRSLIDPTIRPCPVSNSFSILGYFSHSNYS